MNNAIKETLRWLFASVPGAALLVITAGVGFGYAATSGGGDRPDASGAVAFTVPADRGQDLSSSDRQALERFHHCMRDSIDPPSGGKLPDPDQMRSSFQAAFDKCKGELPGGVRQQMEQHQQQAEDYRNCLEENGAKPPSPGDPPGSEDLQQLREAQKACEDEQPEGTVTCSGPGGGPGPIGGPPPGVAMHGELPASPPGAPFGGGGSNR
jgi:hypothetical protein